MTILTHDVRNTQENLEIDTAQALEQPTLSMVDPVSFIFSVNQKGKNKDFKNKELLTTGFEDRTGTIYDLKTAIKSGYAISGAHFQGKRRNTENVSQVGSLLLDFDDGLTIEQAKSDPFITKYCALAYTTPSHTEEHHKFRLIFILPNVMERDDFTSLLKIFLSNFPNADQACRDAGRFFYGNTNAQFFIDNPTTILSQEWIEKAIEQSQVSTQKPLSKPEKKEPVLSTNKNQSMSDLERDRRLLVEVLDLFPSSANGDNNYHTYREIGLVVKNVMGETEALSIMENHSPGRDWKQILESSKGVHSMGSLIYHIRKEIPNWDYPEWWKKSFPNSKESRQENVNKIIESIDKSKDLGERLNSLIDRTDDEETLFQVAVDLAKDFTDPIEDLKRWIEKDFGSLATSKKSRHIQFVGAVLSKYGDNVTELEIAQLIKKTSGISRVDEIKKTLRSVKKKVSPDKTPKQLKIDFIKERIKNLRFNELTGNVERDGKEYKSIELAYISPELSGSDLEIGKDFAVDTIVKLAKDNSFHPVKDYLDSLDVNDRLNESQWNAIASVLLGVPLTDELSNIVLKKFLISAVARIYKPGCYVRLTPVLQGIQDAGKSTFSRLLAGEEFFSDSLGNLDHIKDDLDILHRAWISEWGEIDKLNKKTSGDVKSFITKTSDIYRKPYAKAPETHLRQSVIIGTCNRTDFLKDSTGNTRFSVIPVGKIDLEAVKLYRDRIWATAKYEYLSGSGWELNELEQRMSEINNESYIEVDPWLEEIQNYIHGLPKISVNQLLKDCLKLDTEHYTRADSKRVRDCLNVLGWVERNASYSSFELKKVRHFYPSTQTHSDTEKNSNVSECVSNVSHKTLTVVTFEALDTLDTLKKEKESSSQNSLSTHLISVNQISNEGDLATALIEKNCVYCVSTPQTQSQQEIQEIHNETQNCVQTQNQPDYQFKVGDRVSNPLWGETVITEIDPDKGAKGLWSYQKSESYAPIPSLTLLVEAA